MQKLAPEMNNANTIRNMAKTPDKQIIKNDAYNDH